MARIKSLSQSKSDAGVHPTEVDCTWQVTHSDSGAPLLTLSTYGSDNRVSRPKVSQTIQMDREVARQLMDVLKGAFNL